MSKPQINLTLELIELVKAISNVAQEIRLYSSYGRSFPYTFNELEGLDLLSLSDAIEGLGELVSNFDTLICEPFDESAPNLNIENLNRHIDMLKQFIKHDSNRSWEQPYTTFKVGSLHASHSRPGLAKVSVLKRNDSTGLELEGFIPGMVKVKDDDKFFVQIEYQLVDENLANTPESSEANREVLIVWLIRVLEKIKDKIQQYYANQSN